MEGEFIVLDQFFMVRIVPKPSRLSSTVTNVVHDLSSGGQEPICGIALWQQSCRASSTTSWVRRASRMGRPSSGGPLQLLKTKGTVFIPSVYTLGRLPWARHEYSGPETVRQYGCRSNFD